MSTAPWAGARTGVFALAATDLIFDPATHTSRTPDGREVPHVTTILSATRITTDFDEMAAQSRTRRETVENARDRGTAVHADCHAYDDEDLAWQTVHPEVLPYVEAWATLREQLGLVPLAHGRERRVFHPVYWYTGTLDGIFFETDKPDWLILGDIKTGDPEDAAAHLQTAAYERAWVREHPSLPIRERVSFWLQPGKRIPYKRVNYSERAEAHQDFAVFEAALCVYNNQAGRRRRL